MFRLPIPHLRDLGLPALALLAACAGPGGSGAGRSKDYDYSMEPKSNDFERDGFGTSGLPFWMGLTEPERRALRNRDLAAAGDPSALLDLAIFTSGEIRDEAGYDSIRHRVEAFVANKRRAIDYEKTVVDKGRALFWGMHSEFFPSPFWKGGDGDPRQAGYEFEESAFTAIFLRKKFNCVSSAILYVILARYFGLDAQGVGMASHAFAQLKSPDGRVIEVETTTPVGYSLVHDAAFYKSKGPSWTSTRGLAPTSYAAYQARRILSPIEFIGWNTNNQHAAPARMAQVDRCRLAEAWGYLVPLEREAQANRLALYNIEVRWLKERKDYGSIEALFGAIRPELSVIAANFPGDGELQNRVAWAWFDHGLAAQEAGRGLEAVPSLDSSLARARPEWKEGADAKSNSLGLLQNIASGLVEKERFAEAQALLESRLPQAAGDTNFPRTRSWLHQKWAFKHWNAGDWPAALDQFERQKGIGLRSDAASLQENMVNAYLNWASTSQEKGDTKGAVKALTRCKDRLKSRKCIDLLNRFATAGDQ